jgi:hypothetical protein
MDPFCRCDDLSSPATWQDYWQAYHAHYLLSHGAHNITVHQVRITAKHEPLLVINRTGETEWYMIGPAVARLVNREANNVYRSLRRKEVRVEQLLWDEVRALAEAGWVSRHAHTMTIIEFSGTMAYLSACYPDGPPLWLPESLAVGSDLDIEPEPDEPKVRERKRPNHLVYRSLSSKDLHRYPSTIADIV